MAHSGVTAPLVVTPKVPETVEAARSRALASVSATLLPLVMPTVLKLLPALLRVMLLAAPAFTVVAPATVSGPLCGHRAVGGRRLRSRETVEAARSRALASVSATLLPLVMPTVLKLFAALFKVMLFAAPAFTVVAPATVSGPLWVRAPLVVTLKVPLIVEAARSKRIGIGQGHVVAAR